MNEKIHKERWHGDSLKKTNLQSNKKILVDSNILIYYFASDPLVKLFLSSTEFEISIITELEVL